MAFLRAHVVTPTITYKTHALEINEGQRTATIYDRETSEPVPDRILTEVEWSSADGNVWRVVGLTADGQPQIWRAVKACACQAAAVVPTPEYDVPV